jgi:hypothetical protein
MTILDKRNRIERLAEEPLFFYRTLRDRVEELDSLKAAFQYLLAAYELNMDPAIKAQYEDAKRAAREAQLRDSAATTAAAQLDQEPSIVRHAVLDPGVSHPPEILAKMESQRSGEAMSEVVKGSGMPDAKRPDLAPKAPRPISPRAEASGAVAEAIKEVRGDYGRAVQTLEGSIPKFALSDESILEAKRVLSRQKVAEEVNKVLVQHGVHFTDAQLIDYMDNKMSKEDLERVGQMVDTREAHHDHNPLEKPVVHESVEEDNEFPLTQVGLAQKMLYGKDGLLPKILSSTLTKHGQGPISQADGKVDLRVDHPRSGMITLDQMDESGIYQDAGYSNGILIILEKTDAHPWKYFVWMPQYHTDHREPPMIYCTKYPVAGFEVLSSFETSEVSDIVNRLVHYIVKWQSIVLNRHAMDMERSATGVEAKINKRQPDPSEYEAKGASLILLGKEAEALTEPVATYPEMAKEYPITTPLGQIQRQVYSEDGLLALLLGSALHVGGRGPINTVTGHCTSEPLVILPGDNPVTGFIVNATVNGVWSAQPLCGVLMRCDRGVDYWLPLHLDAKGPLPAIFVSPTAAGHFRSLDTFGPRDIKVLGDFLMANLETWVKSVN